MKTKKLFLAALTVMCAMTMTMLTACFNENTVDPQPKPADGKVLLGSWYCDIKGLTYPLWNDGPAIEVMTFRADGTGVAEVYYIIDGTPFAHEINTFTYTAADGKLTTKADDGQDDYIYQLQTDGKLYLVYDIEDAVPSIYTKADDNMLAQFDTWSKQNLLPVPQPARYTVFVYGTALGVKDDIIEKIFWEKLQPLLKDRTKVRVVCCYKYGMDTNGKYADSGDLVFFELNDKTDLSNLRKRSWQYDYIESKDIKLSDPQCLSAFMKSASLACPAEDYILCLWGIGEGYNPTYDLPGKYAGKGNTRGLLYDQWTDEELNMFAIAQAMKDSGADKYMSTIFFNCGQMGSVETLTELRDVTKYICCSTHPQVEKTLFPAEFVKGLIQNDNVEDAAKQMFEEGRADWEYQIIYASENAVPCNGDFKMVRTSDLNGIIAASKQLVRRLKQLYPIRREAIDRATNKVYRFLKYGDESKYSDYYPFFDLADYANKLAEETGDVELLKISNDMNRAFDNAIVHRAEINLKEQHLDHYSLSVSLYGRDIYNHDFIGEGSPWLSNIKEGYEQSAFHQLTGWGDFLNINEQIPTGNPVGLFVEEEEE